MNGRAGARPFSFVAAGGIAPLTGGRSELAAANPRAECGDRRFHRAETPAEPARDATKHQRDEAEQGGGRGDARRRVGSVRRLLLHLVDGLLILLRVLVDLGARLLDRNPLSSRQRLRRARARRFRLGRVPCDGRTNR